MQRAALRTNPRPRPIPGEVDTWVFDLDNTLYPARDSVFSQVGRRIHEFVARFLELDSESAFTVQRAYFREYGTTLRGLMIRHDLDPVPYLEYVHDVDLSGVVADPALDAALAGLPGRKVIFTNADTGHARRIVERLGIGRHFEGVYDIFDADFVPKPEPAPYADLVRRYGLRAERCVMFEDVARNLAPAAALGMTTVWLRNDAEWAASGHDAAYVHHRVDALAAWLASLSTVENRPPTG